ncbi:hypothetical protein O3M35_000878 [Rhynocoris fuscipes]|uniref:Uncharacterized protein n=1 Tax=Rhynocoris fuscipes TaxID=488301 RepID=A0AAW1DNW3_9HEMI
MKDIVAKEGEKNTPKEDAAKPQPVKAETPAHNSGQEGKIAAPIPLPQIKKLLPPRHLATQTSQLKNDPLYEEAFVVEDDHGLQQEPRTRKFRLSFESLFNNN